MSKVSYWKLIVSPKDALSLLALIFGLSALPILAVISVALKMFAKFGAHFQHYGRFLSYTDVHMDEEFVDSIPRTSMVFTLIIQKDLSIEELRALFQRNVLEARSSTNSDVIRYPELKQYLTTFMGFRIFKNDEDFHIENHIVERPTSHWSNHDDWDNCEHLLTAIHEDLLNIKYRKNRSPWELILIRNPKPDATSKTILAFRMHHVMADAKSIIKLLVECLGGKKLKSATPQGYQESSLDKLKFYTLFPVNWTLATFPVIRSMIQNHFHPFNVPFFLSDSQDTTLLAFSPKIQLTDVKHLAKQYGVTGSAVILSIISGAIRKCRKELGESRLDACYIPPRSNHPEVLTNHAHLGVLSLYTDQPDPVQRLRQCNESFLGVRSIQQCRYFDFGVLLGGSLLHPLSRLVANHFGATGVTNIASDEEGFSVGNGEVSDFRMSVGTTRGAAGVVFCAFSYKDGIRIAVVAKKSVLKKEEVDGLAADICQELKVFGNGNVIV